VTIKHDCSSKERVLTAVQRAEPDRVPMDFLGNPWVLERLHRDLGTVTHRQLLERLQCDIVDLRGVVDPIYRGPVPASRERGDGVRENFWGWRQKIVQSATGPEDCFVEFALAQATSIDDYLQHRWPQPDWFDFSDFAARLEPWQDLAVMASGASVFQHPSFLRGIENLLMDMAVQAEMAHWLIDRFSDFYLEFFDRMLTAAQGRIDILRTADDLGTQRGLFFSPEMFRTFIKPRLKKLVAMTHSHGVKFLFHSCGAIRPLIEDLIEIGVDILDPLQAAAVGMEPQALKDAYGGRLCLHGGICTQYLLPRGTPGEVRNEVRRRLEILGRGGGYILAPCHVLQTDVPTANILAMSEAGVEFGGRG
jgi:uroporphyrinogen decarboxylase